MGALRGWLPDELQRYRRERERIAEERILAAMDRRPGLVVENCRNFNPHRDWQTPVIGR
jgi:hypothetical protein